MSAAPVLGVTGPLAAGKDTACAFFRRQGIPELNVDRIGHQVLERHTDEAVALFGPHILTPDTHPPRVDRARLGELVFGNPRQLQALEALLHPLMGTEVAHWVERLDGPLLINAAVLYDMGLETWCDRVICIWAPPELCVARAATRSGLDPTAARRRLDAQKGINRACALADEVIENTASRDVLYERLTVVYRSLFGGDRYAGTGRQPQEANVYP